MTGWQPIETAPKTKPIVLLLAKSRAVCTGWWERDAFLILRVGQIELRVKENGFTHWQPLPEPPE